MTPQVKSPSMQYENTLMQNVSEIKLLKFK